ncbi:MAG: diguanylate cyclase, partial [Cyanobacteria bacterium P01_H01_bin.130]
PMHQPPPSSPLTAPPPSFLSGLSREDPTTLRQILHNLVDGVIALEPIRNDRGQLVDCRWSFMNSTAEGILGISARDVLDRGVLDCGWCFHEETFCRRLLDLAGQTLRCGYGTLADQFCSQGPVSGWFQLVGVRADDRAIITLRDITLCKRTESRLAIANQRLDVLVQELEKQNRALSRLAAVDSLTQLANRRRLDDYLAMEWLRLYRTRQPLSFVLCDLDHFKAYNDALGHQAGDACLQKVAAALMAVARRPADLMARYGGEEFALVLPETDVEGALQVAENLRSLLGEWALPHPNNEGRPITLSMGIACKVPSDLEAVKTLVMEADQALYAAKAAGRNRVIVSPAATTDSTVGEPELR